MPELGSVGLGALFDEPWYNGQPGSADVPWVLPVGLGGRAFLIDVRKYQRQTVQVRRYATDQTSEPGEQSLSTAGLWKRNMVDWHLGAGQEFYDEPDSDRHRFYTSKGVDIWTRKRLRLLKDTSQVLAMSGITLTWAGGGYLYVADATSTKVASAPDSGTFTTIAGLASHQVTAIAFDGTHVYFAWNGTVQRATVGSATLDGAPWPLTLAGVNLVEYANGRLLATAANVLSEVTAAATATTVFTHPFPSFAFTAICGAPNGIYAAGNSGRGEIYYIGVTASSGALAAPVIACQLPIGELVQTIAEYGGFLVVGTNKGIRIGNIQSNYVQLGALIETNTTYGVSWLERRGQFVWFDWPNYDGSSTGLGRIDMSQFTDTLVPAHASDLMFTGQGLVKGVVTFGDRRFFGVAGAGLVAENATDYVASGQLDSGWIRFSTYEDKAFSSLEMRHDPLLGTISSTLVLDDGSSVDMLASTSAGSLTPGTGGSTKPQVEALRLITTLSRGTATQTPTLRRLTLRALPLPQRSENIAVPLLLRTKVENPQGEGAEMYFDTRATFDWLKSLEANGEIIQYQEGHTTYDVYIDQIMVEPEKWNDEYSFFEGLVTVSLLTVTANG